MYFLNREAAEMSELKKNADHQQRLAALRLAELQMTDQEDFENCVSDMVRSASLDESEASVVASAIRSKYLPALAREAGMDEMIVNKMVNLEDGAEETADFANEDEEDSKMELHHFDDDEDDDTEDLNEDEDEVDDDEETATFEIEVPADMVGAAQKAVQKALDELFGEDTDMDMDDESDLDMDDESMEDDEDSEDDMDDEAE